MSEALRREGLAREIINRVQNVRKAKGLEVSDRIALELRCDGDLAAAARDPALAEMIKGETLSGSLGVAPFEESAAAGDAIGFAGNEVFEIDGESLFVSLHRRGD